MKRNFENSHDVSESKRTKTDSIVEQDFINYISLPPLESIAISNVAIVLCKQTDIRNAIQRHSLEFDPVGDDISCIRGDDYDFSFDKLENSILKNLSLVPLPNLLKAKVANVINPVLLQILGWIRHGRKDTEYMDSVCWTVDGTIDKVKTFEQLVSGDSAIRYITSLYELACTYCLEHRIHNLWNKLTTIKQDNCATRRYKKYENHLLAYWTSIVKNELPGFLRKIKPYDEENIYDCSKSIYQNMFELGIYVGNVLAIKYFWHKLSAKEISCNLERWINGSLQKIKMFRLGYQSSNRYSDVLYFLLSQMECAEKQNEVFRKHSKVILLSLFSDWPRQRFLLPTIQTIWSSLDVKVYVELLSIVAYQIKANKTTETLFRILWRDSPKNLKKSFIQYLSSKVTHVVSKLLNVGDADTVKLMLNYANVEEQRKITFYVVKNSDVYNVIYTDKLSLLDTLIRETLSLDSDIHKLKAEILLEYGQKLCRNWIYDDNFEMVEKFFNWAFTSQDQINNFKNNILDKIEVTYGILKHRGNYELVDKFLSWSFSTEQEINKFKKKFAEFKYEIVTIGEEDWGEFQKFIGWCFSSDSDINDYKCNILISDQIFGIIFDIIVYGYNFEFVDKLIVWCCQTNDEVKQFKTKFVLRGLWLGILQRFVSNYKLYDSEYDNWTLTKKLIKSFFLIDKEEIIKLKERITEDIDFDDYRPDYRGISSDFDKDDLFHFMDNYNTGDDDESTDSDTNTADNQNEIY